MAPLDQSEFIPGGKPEWQRNEEAAAARELRAKEASTAELAQLNHTIDRYAAKAEERYGLNPDDREDTQKPRITPDTKWTGADQASFIEFTDPAGKKHLLPTAEYSDGKTRQQVVMLPDGTLHGKEQHTSQNFSVGEGKWVATLDTASLPDKDGHVYPLYAGADAQKTTPDNLASVVNVNLNTPIDTFRVLNTTLKDQLAR